MAKTLVVSLFLPYTAHFHDKDERRPSPQARQVAHPPITSHTVRPSVDLTRRASGLSLLDDHSVNDDEPVNELFHHKNHSYEQLPITPGNVRSLMRLDAHVPDWGKQAIFNQPRSRAGPLPSGSILDFAKVHEELQSKHHPEAQRTTISSKSSRAGSADREYRNKTWTIEPALHGNGGLTNAMREQPLDIAWIGAFDFPTDALPADTKEELADVLANDYSAEAVYIKDRDFQGHYSGFCKTILWPIFHYQVPDHPTSRAYADHSWAYYKALNQAFADKIIEIYKKTDIIWIHDYHLLLVPKMVRDKLPDAQIGLFLHTAFPSSEVFRCLSMRNELLEGMLGANLVAFQVDEYAQHFLQTCSRILTVETTSIGVQLEDHFVNVISQPIGVNLGAINEQRETAEMQEWIAKINEKYSDKHIIVARDKLDSISGVRHKLLAYELFLNKYPEWREKVVLIQVATSTSEQSELLATVSDIVTRISSVHSTLDHQPLVFLKQDIPFSQYLALLTIADVLIVSSLRDGMNLTTHDYVICQDGKYSAKKHGTVILSEFAGSAALFGTNQIPINPWNFQQQARAIKQALEMSDQEKSRRWNNLNQIVRTHTGGAWANGLADALGRVHEQHTAHDATAIPRLSLSEISNAYKQAKKRVFILDYEGTLAPHRTNAGLLLGSPQRIIDALSDLIQDDSNVVYIMSGRTAHELSDHFKTVPKLGLIAENGCFAREAGPVRNAWTSFPDMKVIAQWKKDVRGVLRYYTERFEGTYIEERECSILVRFEKCENKDAVNRTIGECADHINGAFNKMKVRAVPINQAILIETLEWNKAAAAQKILEHMANHDKQGDGSITSVADFLMIAGDDREDEGIFRWANRLDKSGEVNNVFTVSVGKRNTEAKATLTQGTSGLLTVLTRLAKVSADALPTDYFNVKSRA